MRLMLKDNPVLEMDSNITRFKLINPKLLPYQLFTLKFVNDISLLRDWISKRFIYPNFKNYKAVVDSISDIDIQSEVMLKVVCAFHAVAVNDCYWVQFKDETFDSIYIQNSHLIDTVIDASLLGIISTITLEDLHANVSIHGTFPKSWIRENNNLYLIKTDTNNYLNVLSELASQRLLDVTGINNCKYTKYIYKNEVCTKTKCFTNDEVMFISFADIRFFFDKVKFDYKNAFKKQLAEMAYIDFITGNTDRHLHNFGFLVDANTNALFGFAPLFDFNISMYTTSTINNKLRTEIYKPTNKTILESAVDAISILQDTVPLEFKDAPDFVEERLKILKANLKSNKIFIPNTHYGISKTVAERHKIDWNNFNECKLVSEQIMKGDNI